MVAGVIDQSVISGQGIRIVLMGAWGGIDDRLQRRMIAFGGHAPAHITVRRALYLSYHVVTVFFVPIKVYNSSSSSTRCGSGGAGGVEGKVRACALTQFATV